MILKSHWKMTVIDNNAILKFIIIGRWTKFSDFTRLIWGEMGRVNNVDMTEYQLQTSHRIKYK